MICFDILNFDFALVRWLMQLSSLNKTIEGRDVHETQSQSSHALGPHPSKMDTVGTEHQEWRMAAVGQGK